MTSTIKENARTAAGENDAPLHNEGCARNGTHAQHRPCFTPSQVGRP